MIVLRQKEYGAGWNFVKKLGRALFRPKNIAKRFGAGCLGLIAAGPAGWYIGRRAADVHSYLNEEDPRDTDE